MFWFFGFWLFVVADGKSHREAGNAIVRQLLKAHSQILAHLLVSGLERRRTVLVGAPRTDAKLLVRLRLADPDDTALLNAVTLLEADNLVLVVLELLVLLKVGRALSHLVESRLVAQNEPLVAVGDVVSVELFDVVKIVGDVGR